MSLTLTVHHFDVDSTGKQLFAAGGTELSAGAYPTVILNDVIAFSAVFPKLQ